MKIKLICGFLGAGKTTLVKNILSHGNGDTAFLVNDFGDMGIDGEIVSQTRAVNIIELPSGCICCSLRTDFSQGITQIYEQYNPGKLLIEPTGIATPSAILEVLQEHELQDKFEIEPVVGVVNPANFFDFIGDYGNFFMDQILNSDIILINKIDLVTKEQADSVEEKIRELNPSALIYRTEYCEQTLPSLERRREVKGFLFNWDFETLSFESEKKIIEKDLLDLFNTLGSGIYGRVLRAKGIFKTDGGFVNLDFASDVVSKHPLNKAENSKLVVIGEKIDKERIIADVQKCTS